MKIGFRINDPTYPPAINQNCQTPSNLTHIFPNTTPNQPSPLCICQQLTKFASSTKRLSPVCNSFVNSTTIVPYLLEDMSVHCAFVNCRFKRERYRQMLLRQTVVLRVIKYKSLLKCSARYKDVMVRLPASARSCS